MTRFAAFWGTLLTNMRRKTSRLMVKLFPMRKSAQILPVINKGVIRETQQTPKLQLEDQSPMLTKPLTRKQKIRIARMLMRETRQRRRQKLKRDQTENSERL